MTQRWPALAAFTRGFTRAKLSLAWLGFINLFLLIGCSQTDEPSSQASTPTQAQILVFGTHVNIVVYHPDPLLAQAAIREVEQTFAQFHIDWHAWEKGGVVGKINSAIAQQSPIDVADSVKSFILKSQQLTRQSNGLFDPGIGQLIALWGFHSEHWQGPPPPQSKIDQWLKDRPSILDLTFNGQTLTSRNPNVQLDFGGNAKGLAIDIALNTLQSAGIQNALVSIGGDMKVIGHKPKSASNAQTLVDQAWSIGIQNPSQPNQVVASLNLYSNESVVTSGTYQRYFEWQGQRYSHIINPNTGYPANGFASVTVIHPDATTADAAATALLIAGPEQWQTIAQKMGVSDVFCITQNGEFLQTKGMEKRLKLL
ncbi:FAD:protein FMN transferase [Thiomicrorhabdus aquaedulcis]|uniref:FAD:protein FMN transferase n=1 Tax=Thiomicrorhabdus aquaedulcis TaxID=2211106 RepID=UPI001E483F6F|nr:FAD:protein FMN transferase [Thiomicrorhabdus aquaedulcis]